MGLADRDYMRERHAKRTGGTIWNSRKSRVEFDDGVPLGSASWIGKEATWTSQPADLRQHGRRTRRGPRFRQHPAQKWIFLISALTVLIPAYREMKHNGWLPDTEPAIAFPATGSVTVNRGVNPKRATSRMIVHAAEANAVVQLYDPDNDEHVISVYVRRHDEATIPVPPGTYRMEVVEGDKWHGPERYFGRSTTYDTVAKEMTFTRRMSNGIDLHRTPAGNLKTRANITNPRPLE